MLGLPASLLTQNALIALALGGYWLEERENRQGDTCFDNPDEVGTLGTSCHIRGVTRR